MEPLNLRMGESRPCQITIGGRFIEECIIHRTPVNTFIEQDVLPGSPMPIEHGIKTKYRHTYSITAKYDSYDNIITAYDIVLTKPREKKEVDFIISYKLNDGHQQLEVTAVLPNGTVVQEVFKTWAELTVFFHKTKSCNED